MALWWILTRYPALVACTANTQHQLETVLWGEIGRWSRRLQPGLRELIEVKADKVVLTAAGRGIVGFTPARRRRSGLRLWGFHSDNMLFLVEEASGVFDIVFEVAQGSLTTPGRRSSWRGTRRGGRVLLQRIQWAECGGLVEAAGQRVRELAGHAKSIDWAAKEYREASNRYRVRVMGEFPGVG